MGDQPPALWDAAAKQLIGDQKKAMLDMLGPIQEDVGAVKNEVQTLKTGQQGLEARVAALEAKGGASSTEEWVPTYLDI